MGLRLSSVRLVRALKASKVQGCKWGHGQSVILLIKSIDTQQSSSSPGMQATDGATWEWSSKAKRNVCRLPDRAASCLTPTGPMVRRDAPRLAACD